MESTTTTPADGQTAVFLDDLFRVVAEVNVRGRILWIRALSDFDIQARDQFALLKSAQKRKRLRDPNSNDYVATLEWLETAPDEELRSSLILMKSSELTRNSVMDIRVKIIAMPDKPTEEERLDIIDKREKEAERVNSERLAYIKARLDEYKESLKDLAHDDLLKRTRENQTLFSIQAESIRSYESYTIYAGYFTDRECLHHYLESPDDSTKLASNIRAQLVNLYYKEMDRVSQLDLQYFLSTGGSTASSKPSTVSETNENPA